MRSSAITPLVVIILISFVLAYAGWEPCSSGTTVSLYGVACGNLVAQPEVVYVVGELGTILKSTNYGDTWTPCNSGTSVTLRDVCFIEGSANIAFVVGDGAALRTTDYGASWHSMSVPSTANLCAVSASLGPDQHVFIVNNTNQVFRSTNCGDTWTTLTLQSGLQLGDIITEYNGFHIEAVSSTGYVAKTRDGGSNWLYDPFTNVSLLSITEATRYRWWVGGYYAGATNLPRVYITEDSGLTYTQVYDGIAGEMVTGVTTAGQDYCFACGMVSGNPDSSGFILRFNNYGQSCIEQVTGYPFDFYNIDNYGRYYAWVVGEQGLILRTTDGGGDGVIRITVPNGGEYWERGNSYDIIWLSDKVPGSVMIELYKDNNPYDTIAYNIPNTHQYNYYVPFSLPQADDYQVKITSMDNPQICDISDDYFMIGSGVNITVTYPNGGEFLKTRDTCYITWESSGITGNVRIWLYWDGGSQYIEYDTLNSGLYPWYIPSHQERDTTYRVRIQSIDYPTVDDYSDDDFSIGKQIAVIQPTTGDTLYAGGNYEILWDSAGIGGYVSIEYSTDGGWEWDTVVASTYDDGSYIWQNIPNKPTEVGRVLIKHLSYNNTNNAQSDGFFTIIGTGKPWTILIYMIGDNNCERPWIDEINEMERVVDTSMYNIIVRLDRIGPGYSWDDDTSNGDWRTTRDYYITYDPLTDRIIRSTLLVDNGELNMGDTTTLIEFATKYIDDYPASRYLINFASHGNGWRTGSETLYTQFFRQLGDDVTNNYDYIGLTNSEYFQSLSAISNHIQRKIDIFAHLACLMGMHEVTYEAKNFVDYMVFSEYLMWFNPWNSSWAYPYTTMLLWLNDHPNAIPSEFASVISVKYVEQFLGNPTNSATHSVVTTNQEYIQLCEKINLFAQELIAAGGAWQSEIFEIRQNTQEYPEIVGGTSSERVDLYDFAERIMNSSTLPNSLKESADSVMDAITSTVIQEAHYTAWPLGHPVDGSHGLAIYYPRSPIFNDSAYLDLRWTQDYTSWWNFLQGTVNVNESNKTILGREFLVHCSPNPSDFEIVIEYYLPIESMASLAIYNTLGQCVRNFDDIKHKKGFNRISWKGESDNGPDVPAGVYFLRFLSAEYGQYEKLILIK